MLNSLKRMDRSLVIGADDDYRRCYCGELVRPSNQKQLARHVGHRMGTAWSFTFWEWVRIKVGLL